ncbi:MAG: hypothetical protein ACKOWF_04230, partial [Chloroflexota bacterium]
MGESADDPPEQVRYRHLERRAEEFLRGRGGSAPEDLLIAYVYGAGFRPEFWRATFREQMGHCPTLRLRADGCW